MCECGDDLPYPLHVYLYVYIHSTDVSHYLLLWLLLSNGATYWMLLVHRDFWYYATSAVRRISFRFNLRSVCNNPRDTEPVHSSSYSSSFYLLYIYIYDLPVCLMVLEFVHCAASSFRFLEILMCSYSLFCLHTSLLVPKHRPVNYVNEVNESGICPLQSGRR